MKTLNLTDLEKSDIKYKISKFPDGQQDIVILGEIAVSYEPLITYGLVSKPVQILSRFNSFKDLELIICANQALKRLNIKEIHLYVPYLLGARSDRHFQNGGNSYLVNVIAPVLNAQNFESVSVMDVHSDVAAACIKNLINVDNTELVKHVLFNDICSQPGFEGIEKLSKIILISPDAGSLKKIYKIADIIGYTKDIIVCSKSRDVNGKLTNTIVPIKYEESEDIVIIDDICDGGQTFINISEALNDAGHKGKKYLIVTHGIFSKGYVKLSRYFDGIYCTNSVKDIKDFEGNDMIKTNVKQLNVY